MKWVRRLYDWVLSWAETPYGTAALAVLAFAESSFFPIPPDVLLIALCIGHRKKALWFATVCAAASLLGGIFGYLIGWGLWSMVDQLFFAYVPGFTEAGFNHVKSLYDQYNFWIVFVAAFTPIPYKIITIAAGVCHINFPMFLVASCIGRSARFFLVAGLLYFFGERIRTFIDKWFDLLAIAFTVLLIGGFVVLKMLSD
jgi:membrane protein YqaA with SNARE-associated domain